MKAANSIGLHVCKICLQRFIANDFSPLQVCKRLYTPLQISNDFSNQEIKRKQNE